MATASRYRSEGGMRPESCCSERSSNNDGFASSNVLVREGRYSMMGGKSKSRKRKRVWREALKGLDEENVILSNVI